MKRPVTRPLHNPRRRLVGVLFFLVAAVGVAALPAHAYAQQRTAVGIIDVDAALLRSGPSDKDYPVLRLSRGQQVVAVGQKFDWLKVIPPEGTFCYVGKAFVERRGTGDVGRVTAPSNVRYGSRLVELKNKLAVRLAPGADVKIIGEDAEYFLIEPPEGVYLYIAKSDVVPARSPAAAAINQPGGSGNGTMTPDARQPAADNAGDVDAAAYAAADTEAMSGTTVTPGTTLGGLAQQMQAQPPVVNAPEANPALDAFEALEARARETAELPLEQQPIDELHAGYQDLLTQELPESFRLVAEARMKTYEVRKEALADFNAVQKMRQELAEKRSILQAEQAELEQRIVETTIRSYAALGTVRSSSLQVGQKPLYRLTDPATGRTVIYIRTDDPKIALMMGQFVGIQGQITDDTAMQLRYVSPTRIERVDSNEVFKSVTADVVPPSLLGRNATAASPTE